jgi:molybdate transport system regulatory protein
MQRERWPFATLARGIGGSDAILPATADRDQYGAMTEFQDMPRYRIRVVFGEGEMIGPGKAELLERIGRTGSIAAAGREMGMSYKRAWQLVETLNGMFRAPLVESSRGGARGGGARVTEAGEAVLAEYRALEDAARRAGQPHLDRLQEMRGDMSGRK